MAFAQNCFTSDEVAAKRRKCPLPVGLPFSVVFTHRLSVASRSSLALERRATVGSEVELGLSSRDPRVSVAEVEKAGVFFQRVGRDVFPTVIRTNRRRAAAAAVARCRSRLSSARRMMSDGQTFVQCNCSLRVKKVKGRPKAKGRGHTRYSALSERTSPQKRSGTARIVERFHCFICTPQSAQDRYVTAIRVVSCSSRHATLGNWSIKERRTHDLSSHKPRR